jgi:hypothetical protein
MLKQDKRSLVRGVLPPPPIPCLSSDVNAEFLL